MKRTFDCESGFVNVLANSWVVFKNIRQAYAALEIRPSCFLVNTDHQDVLVLLNSTCTWEQRTPPKKLTEPLEDQGLIKSHKKYENL